jgi:hypothetical protein
MIPDEPQRIGGGPKCDLDGCDTGISERKAATPGPSHCREHFYTEWFDGKAGECPDCGGQLVYWDADNGRETACADCMDGINELTGKTIDTGFTSDYEPR